MIGERQHPMEPFVYRTGWLTIVLLALTGAIVPLVWAVQGAHWAGAGEASLAGVAGAAIPVSLALAIGPLSRDQERSALIILLSLATVLAYYYLYTLTDQVHRGPFRHRYLLPAAALVLAGGGASIARGGARRRAVQVLLGAAVLFAAVALLGSLMSRYRWLADRSVRDVDRESGAMPALFHDPRAVAALVARGDTAGTIDGKRVVSVKSFGATGDGRTDDQPAIQRTVDALNAGGIAFFPSGEYRVGASILLGSGVHLVGSGRDSVIIRALPDGKYKVGIIFNYPRVSDVGVFELTVNGDRYARRALSTEAGIFFDGVTRPVIQRVHVLTTQGECARFNDGSVDGVIDSSLLENCGTDEGAENVNPANGILLASPVDTIFWTNKRPPNTARHRITRNTIDGARNTGIALINVTDVLIAQNHITRSKRSRGINMGTTSSHIVVVDNVVEYSHSTGIHAYGASDIEIFGNTVLHTLADGSGRGIEGQGIKAYVHGRHLRIWGNTTRFNFTDGIAVLPGIEDVVIEGNVSTDNHRDGIRAEAGNSGGLPSADVAEVRIIGNETRFNDESGIRLLVTGGVQKIRGWEVSHNIVEGNREFGLRTDSLSCGGFVAMNTWTRNRRGAVADSTLGIAACNDSGIPR